MKIKATDALLADHRLIDKVLDGFVLDNPRFAAICKTLHRAVKGHAWFEDQIFLPALKDEPLIFRRFSEEIVEEHRDIDALLQLVRRTDLKNRDELAAYSLQLRSLLATHFRKEEDALFPLAEKVLPPEKLWQLADEMKRRQTEIRTLID